MCFVVVQKVGCSEFILERVPICRLVSCFNKSEFPFIKFTRVSSERVEYINKIIE